MYEYTLMIDNLFLNVRILEWCLLDQYVLAKWGFSGFRKALNSNIFTCFFTCFFTFHSKIKSERDLWIHSCDRAFFLNVISVEWYLLDWSSTKNVDFRDLGKLGTTNFLQFLIFHNKMKCVRDVWIHSYDTAIFSKCKSTWMMFMKAVAFYKYKFSGSRQTWNSQIFNVLNFS